MFWGKYHWSSVFNQSREAQSFEWIWNWACPQDSIQDIRRDTVWSRWDKAGSKIGGKRESYLQRTHRSCGACVKISIDHIPVFYFLLVWFFVCLYFGITDWLGISREEKRGVKSVINVMKSIKPLKTNWLYNLNQITRSTLNGEFN